VCDVITVLGDNYGVIISVAVWALALGVLGLAAWLTVCRVLARAVRLFDRWLVDDPPAEDD
jgi:hypothetical protein